MDARPIAPGTPHDAEASTMNRWIQAETASVHDSAMATSTGRRPTALGSLA